jgi:serine/alanine adding enzyme
MIISDHNRIDKDKWSAFVLGHPNGTIFQTPDIFDVYLATKNYEPVVVASTDKNELNGILVAIIQKEYPGLVGWLTARSIIWGGPLAKENNPEIIASLLEHYDRLVKHKAVYSQFRNLFDMNTASGLFIRLGYYHEEHLNILIDLNPSEEQLWKGIHSKRRNEIRKAEKEGVTVDEINNPDNIRRSYSILKEVYQRAKLPIPDQSLFNNAFKILGSKGYMKVFGAFYQKKLIGTMYVFSYHKRIYDWYAGSFRDYYKKHPNDLIPWVVIKKSKAQGFSVFDFGGAGKPGMPYKVRDYKQQYGGEVMNFGRFEKINQPFIYNISKLAFKIWQKLKALST